MHIGQTDAALGVADGLSGAQGLGNGLLARSGQACAAVCHAKINALFIPAGGDVNPAGFFLPGKAVLDGVLHHRLQQEARTAD